MTESETWGELVDRLSKLDPLFVAMMEVKVRNESLS
jgi:hypothetical protein